jgi:hypothetical protein
MQLETQKEYFSPGAQQRMTKSRTIYPGDGGGGVPLWLVVIVVLQHARLLGGSILFERAQRGTAGIAHASVVHHPHRVGQGHMVMIGGYDGRRCCRRVVRRVVVVMIILAVVVVDKGLRLVFEGEARFESRKSRIGRHGRNGGRIDG